MKKKELPKINLDTPDFGKTFERKKTKWYEDLFNLIVLLGYLFMIGALASTLCEANKTIYYSEVWILVLNLVLLCIGIYNFTNRKK